MNIESLEKWNRVAEKLRYYDYQLWQWQYDVDAPEGFYARFIASGWPEIEIVTHDENVYNAIMQYR